MKQHKIGEVFLDTKHFKEPKRLKCIEDVLKGEDGCSFCIYRNHDCYGCVPSDREDGEYAMFIETDEPLSEKNETV